MISFMRIPWQQSTFSNVWSDITKDMNINLRHKAISNKPNYQKAVRQIK